MARLHACEMGALRRALHDHFARGGGNSGGKELPFVLAGRFEVMDELELLLHGGALAALGEHGVQIDHVGRVPKMGHGFDAVFLEELHAPCDVGELGVSLRAGYRVARKGCDGGVRLVHAHAEPGSGQEKRVLAKPCRSVDRPRLGAAADLRRADEEFACKAVFPDAGKQLREVAAKLHPAADEGEPAFVALKRRGAGLIAFRQFDLLVAFPHGIAF